MDGKHFFEYRLMLEVYWPIILIVVIRLNYGKSRKTLSTNFTAIVDKTAIYELHKIYELIIYDLRRV